MTRKRFVKLAMANGYSRNAANNIAKAIPASGKSYAEVYATLEAVKKLEAILTSPALSELVEKFAKAVNKMAKAIREGAAAFSSAYSAAMTEE